MLSIFSHWCLLHIKHFKHSAIMIVAVTLHGYSNSVVYRVDQPIRGVKRTVITVTYRFIYCQIFMAFITVNAGQSLYRVMLDDHRMVVSFDLSVKHGKQ